jgi:hypothetical protein
MSLPRSPLILDRKASEFWYWQRIEIGTIASRREIEYIDMAKEWNHKGVADIAHI